MSNIYKSQFGAKFNNADEENIIQLNPKVHQAEEVSQSIEQSFSKNSLFSKELIQIENPDTHSKLMRP